MGTEANYSLKPVLLGICDEEITGDVEGHWSTNKLGGIPDFMSQPFPGVQCRLCGCPLSLVIQVYCPLQASEYHRTLYVFGCVNRPCWNKSESWTVYRCQHVDVTETSSHKNFVKDDDDWCAGADEWGDVAMGSVAIDTLPGNKVTRSSVSDWCDGADDWGEDDGVVASLSSKQEDNTAFETKHSEYAAGDGQLNEVISIENSQRKHCLSVTPEITEQTRQQGLASGQVQEKSGSSETDPLPIHELSLDDCSSSDIKADPQCFMEDIIDPNESSLKDMLNFNDTNTSQNQSCMKSNGLTIKSFYINVVEEAETQDMTVDRKHVGDLVKAYCQKEGIDVGQLGIQERDERAPKSGKTKDGKSGSGEGYEKTVARHGDRVFQKFLKKIAACSEQILRYQWDGQPLCLTTVSQSQSHVPRCTSCGGVRVFEMQLMPALVPLLCSEKTVDPVIEFGTVDIFTCRNSCWVDSCLYREELAKVQVDPDSHMFK